MGDVMSKIEVRNSNQVTINEKDLSNSANASKLQNKLIKASNDNLKEKEKELENNKFDVDRFDYYKKDYLFKDYVISKYVNKIK